MCGTAVPFWERVQTLRTQLSLYGSSIFTLLFRGQFRVYRPNKYVNFPRWTTATIALVFTDDRNEPIEVQKKITRGTYV
jgi:hypothetical protein